MEEKKKNVNKRKRFTDLAPIRVNNVLKHLRLVGNMTNKNNYDYHGDEFKKILKEAEDLIKNGAKEITLLGQNVNAYSFYENNKEFRISAYAI